MFTLISLKTEIARSASGPKLQGLRAEDAKAKPYLEQWINGQKTTSHQKRYSNSVIRKTSTNRA